jgi:hypothetical protein
VDAKDLLKYKRKERDEIVLPAFDYILDLVMQQVAKIDRAKGLVKLEPMNGVIQCLLEVGEL